MQRQPQLPRARAREAITWAKDKKRKCIDHTGLEEENENSQPRQKRRGYSVLRARSTRRGLRWPTARAPRRWDAVQQAKAANHEWLLRDKKRMNTREVYDSDNPLAAIVRAVSALDTVVVRKA